MYSLKEYSQQLLEVVEFDKHSLLKCREIIQNIVVSPH